MKRKLSFHQAHFLTSALHPQECPSSSLPEIALVGRSNVGKSSLINHLLETKHLAKTSSKPGKTRRINFFSIARSFLLVDLPGYGYAATSKKEQQTWSYYLDLYLKDRPLTGLVFLCDMRRKINDDDQLLLDWVANRRLPLICVLTKADKLSSKEQQAAVAYFKQHLTHIPFFPYSIKKGKCRSTLRHHIEALVAPHPSITNGAVPSWA
ncbi:MAG: ribosome biogenesis GTP-binding protein YihA/YsxC [Chlamydiota bacterium]